VLPEWNCEALSYINPVAFVFSLSPTTLLFFLRLRAVFLNRRLPVAVFAILWASVPVSAIVSAGFMISLNASQGPHDGYCKVKNDPRTEILREASLGINAAYSTLVFVTISWKLLAVARHRQNMPLTWAFMRGTAGSRIANALLREGQAYYL
jgi:hypothetical protein